MQVVDKYLNAKEVVTKIPRTKIMNAIARDDSFSYNAVRVDIREIEKYKKYEYTVYFDKNDLTKNSVESYEPTDEFDGITWHNMFKKPQNNYAAVIVLGTKENYDTQFILHYEKGSAAKAAIELTDTIIQKFIDYKKVSSITEIQSYIREYEKKKKGEDALKKRIESYRKR